MYAQETRCDDAMAERWLLVSILRYALRCVALRKVGMLSTEVVVLGVHLHSLTDSTARERRKAK